MTITIDLEPEQEKQLQKRAHGQEPNNYVKELVLRDLQTAVPQEMEGKTLAGSLEGLIGVLSSGKPHLAENAEQEWGKGLVEKYRAQGLTLKDDERQ